MGRREAKNKTSTFNKFQSDETLSTEAEIRSNLDTKALRHASNLEPLSHGALETFCSLFSLMLPASKPRGKECVCLWEREGGVRLKRRPAGPGDDAILLFGPHLIGLHEARATVSSAAGEVFHENGRDTIAQHTAYST